MTEEQRKQCEEIINSYEEKYKKDFEEINTSVWGINANYTNPIFKILFYGFTSFENEYAEFIVKSNNIAGKNIIDLTVSLSEVLKKNMTKEEAEKLLFTNDIKSDWQFKHSDKFYKSTVEFNDIMNPKIKYPSPDFETIILASSKMSVSVGAFVRVNSEKYFKSIGWNIVNYFDNENKNKEIE